MRAIAIGHLALRHAASWDTAPSIDIRFDGKQVIEGKATAFTNPAIEASIVHSRALLEFLGLGLDKQGALSERGARAKTDDVAVEQFTGATKLTIAKVREAYPENPDEAVASLAHVIYLANKGLAHTTSSFTKHDRGAHLLEMALRGVPVLAVNGFYVPLGIMPPEYQLQGRPAGRAHNAA